MVKFPDFKEFIGFLKENNVKFLVVGGFAVHYHSRFKTTEDLDIWVSYSKNNSQKVINALKKFWFEKIDIKLEDIAKPDKIIQFGYPPLRIDLMTSIEGIDFDKAYKNKKLGNLFGIKNVPIISYNDLVKNKKLVARKKDKFDLDWLKKYNNPKSKK